MLSARPAKAPTAGAGFGDDPFHTPSRAYRSLRCATYDLRASIFVLYYIRKSAQLQYLFCVFSKNVICNNKTAPYGCKNSVILHHAEFSAHKKRDLSVKNQKKYIQTPSFMI